MILNIKNIFRVVFISGLLILLFGFSASTNAQTNDRAALQAQIQSLLAQVSALQAQINSKNNSAAVCPYTWNRNLTIGSTGPDVKRLQQFLNSNPVTQIAVSGVGSKGQETEYYGTLTGAAVAKLQNQYRQEILAPAGLALGTNFFGHSTRAKLNQLCLTTPQTAAPDPEETAVEKDEPLVDETDNLTEETGEESSEEETTDEEAGKTPNTVGTKPKVVKTSAETMGSNSDYGVFTIEFNLTAFNGDFYIAPFATTSNDKSNGGMRYTIEGTSNFTGSATPVVSATAKESASGALMVREGSTETFTLSVTLDPDTAGQYRVALNDVYYSDSSDGVTAASTYVASPATDFRTKYTYIK